MPEFDTAAVEAPAAPPQPTQTEQRQEPPHVMPGSAPEPPGEDDGSPLDDVVDEDSHRPRGSRAKSKKAAARINALTGEIYNLRQRLSAAERAQQRPAPQAPKHVFQVPTAPKVEFSDPEPKLEDVARRLQNDPDADAYGEWLLEKAEWRLRKKQVEQVQGHQQQHVEHLTRQQQEFWNQVEVAHKHRMTQAVSANPRIIPLIQEVAERLPYGCSLDQAIKLDSDGVSMAMFLASRPEVLDELVAMTAALPVTDQTVAMTRRLLRQRMTAGLTGSVAPANVSPAPRPPNPVRTAPMRTSDTAPAESSSIADHAKYFGSKAR